MSGPIDVNVNWGLCWCSPSSFSLCPKLHNPICATDAPRQHDTYNKFKSDNLHCIERIKTLNYLIRLDNLLLVTSSTRATVNRFILDT